MYKNVYYDSYNGQMHVWSGVDSYEIVDFVPYVFVPVEVETNTKSIFGDYVAKKTFTTNKEYNFFQSSEDSVMENKVQPPIQYLTKRYRKESLDNPPSLHIGCLDIETPHDKGFPTVEKTPAPVVLIAIVDEKQQRTIFGIGEYSRNPEYVPWDDVVYFNCEDEQDLLIRFFNWMHEQQFDVITGWNVNPDNKKNKFGGFDLPYLVRRSKMLFGKNDRHHKKLSPINKVRITKSKNIEGVYSVDISGVTIIDYLAVYKWFTTNNMESFKLDYVAEVELSKNKLSYSEYGSLYNLYIQNWDMFVDYCLIDANIVYDLEKKLGYIKLVQTLTNFCLVPMKNYNSSVALIEGLFLKYFRNNNLCAPQMERGLTQEHFPAAYVKPPQIGIHDDVSDIDIKSSYPTHEIIMNMGNETYFGRIIGFEKGHIRDFKANMGIHEELHFGRPIYKMNVDHTRKKEYPEFYILKDSGIEHYTGEKLAKFNTILQKKLISIAPNGAIFLNQPRSVTAIILKETYLERVKQKGLKGEYKNKAKDFEKGSDEYNHWMELSNNKHSLQLAIKIIINSFFGITGVPYCRYCNVNIAEAITSCGRHTIQMSEVFVNELLNNPNKSKELSDIIQEIKDRI